MIPEQGFNLQKADCVMIDPLSDEPMSVVSVRLLRIVHPQVEGQGVQSVASDQGKT